MTLLLDSVADLTSALEQQRDAFVSMLDLTRREERAIVGGDVEALTSLTEEREHILELLAALEAERMTAIVAIASSTGADAHSLTLTSVAAHLAGESGDALTSLGMDLRRRAMAVRDANERNAHLLRASRDIVDRWVHYLRSLMSSALYDAEGRVTEVTRATRVNRTA
jgi:flagellar biosynthesis/type III secretory pathway chaperone